MNVQRVTRPKTDDFAIGEVVSFASPGDRYRMMLGRIFSKTTRTLRIEGRHSDGYEFNMVLYPSEVVGRFGGVPW